MSDETEDNQCPKCGDDVLTLRCTISVHSERAPKVTWSDGGPIVQGYYVKHDEPGDVQMAELHCQNCGASWSSSLDAHGATTRLS